MDYLLLFLVWGILGFLEWCDSLINIWVSAVLTKKKLKFILFSIIYGPVVWLTLVVSFIIIGFDKLKEKG